MRAAGCAEMRDRDWPPSYGVLVLVALALFRSFDGANRSAACELFC